MPANSNRPMNLEDIAAKAGVSRSTVSRVINNEPYVSDKTRQRVLTVIEQEEFAPNPVARALVTQRTQVIGVVIPHVPIVVFEDAYYFPFLLQGVARITHERDYAMLLWLGQAGESSDRFYNRIIRNRLMDGVIIASAASNDPLIDHFLETGAPFVMVECPQRDWDRISYVSVDNVAAAYTAVSHLIALGRRRIAHITGNLAISDGRDRVEADAPAHHDHGGQGRPLLRELDELDTRVLFGRVEVDQHHGEEAVRDLVLGPVDVAQHRDPEARLAQQAVHALADRLVRVEDEDFLTCVDLVVGGAHHLPT